MLVVIPTRPLLLVYLVLLDTILVVLVHRNVLVVWQASMPSKELPNARCAQLEQFRMRPLLPAHLVQKACTRTLARRNVLGVQVTTAVIDDGGRATVPMLLILFRVSLNMTIF